MLPTGLNQTQPSLSSYFSQISSAFSSAVRTHSTDRSYEAAGSVMQINYGLINIPAVGSHNEITVHYHSTGSDAQLLREILRPLQSMAMQPNNAPLASLGIEGLQKKYLESLQKDREIKDALAMYVAPECTSIANIKERFSLEERVRDFLASKEKKVLLLLGVAGSGKSTFNRYLARSLWEAYDKEANKSGQTPIPLFIPLSSLKEPNSNLISEYLKEEKFTEEQIADLKANYRFIFILDGYDEIKDRTRLFYVENELDEWHAKVIVTSRPEYLGDRYERQFHPKGQAYLLQTYQFAPFSDLSIEEYVNKYKSTYPELGKSVSGYGEILGRSEVKELIRNPFLLKLSLSELPALAEKYKDSSQRITRLALYDQFVEGWFERSQDRLSGIRLTDKEQEAFDHLNKDFTKYGAEFSKDFAVALYQTGLPHVTYLAQPSWKRNSTQDWCEKFLNNRDAETKLLRFNAPLICRDEQYEFIHKSIQDYFVARVLWEELGAHDKIERSSWLNTLNIVKDPAVLQFLAERMQQKRELKEHLLMLVEQSKGKEGAQFERGAANAITVLVRAGVQFNEADLKGIRIPGADLSCGVFDSAQLQGADLSEVNCRQAWLRGANLSKAQMTGVKFGEWPYLQEESSVTSCAYSPDGKNYAVGLGNGKVSVYWTSNWEKIYTLEGQTTTVTSVAYSLSGEQLASGGWDRMVRLWDPQSGALVHTLEGHTEIVTSVAYSPSGAQLASGSKDNTVRLWEAESGALIHTLEGHIYDVSSVAYSPNGTQLASGSMDYTVRLWDVQSGALVHTLEGHIYGVSSVAYSLSGAQLALGVVGNMVRLWDVQSGSMVHTLEGHIYGVSSVAYSPNGAQLASGSQEGVVRLWDPQSGVLVHTLEGHISNVTSVAYSPSGAQLASGSLDCTVRLWDSQSGASMPSLGHTLWVTSVAYSPSGAQIASGGWDKTVRLWEAESGALVHTLEGHKLGVSSVAYSPSGAQLASGSSDCTVRLWDSQSGALVHTLEGHTSLVDSVAYSPSGAQLALGGVDNTVWLWDVQSRSLVHTLEGHTNNVRSVVYSPSGAQLASSGSRDNMVRLWDVQSGSLVRILEGHTGAVNSVVYSPSGKLVASGSSDKTVRLWEVESGASVRTLEGHTSSVKSVVYSPSGEQLASGGNDKTVRLWEVTSGECLRVIQGFNGDVNSVAWEETSKGSYLVTGSADKSVRRWEVKKEGEEYKVRLCWSKGPGYLTASGAFLEGIEGLSKVNEKLLKQRGAVTSRELLE
ncbi:NB-ARC domain protein [Mycoavidus cysteinexigens]|uniref:NB-ARC domain protein n=1 Tax=Mycoavidus cysteinexigens TaxID=1553431 RepID=A0A2Z6EVQ3_9BURK|nr:NACHT domain-containing protein [Mycoavidus cysteinexigens]BBE09534.1 NB-ARC domain protein [Mycoavidus cysteinexigens]GLR01765.1 hypothetical protein GCM10007934_15770 [Mycoavidus cysteinexigens]